jgi:hypothetical protein
MTSEPVKSPKWNNTEGHGIKQAIAVLQTPWKAGIYDCQQQVVSEVLDCTYFIYINVTSSTFSFPILVLHYNPMLEIIHEVIGQRSIQCG